MIVACRMPKHAPGQRRRAAEPIRVVVVDDQELFRRGLTMLLGVEARHQGGRRGRRRDLRRRPGRQRGARHRAARRPDAEAHRARGLHRDQGAGAGRADHHADRQRRGGRPLRGGQERRLRLPAQGLLDRRGRPGGARGRRGPVADQPVDGGQAARRVQGDVAHRPRTGADPAAHRPRARGAAPGRDRPQQPRGRQAAVHQREHGEEPRPQHPGEAAAPLPDGGRDVRRPREAARHP